jgi:nucleoside-diphosphate-sugar epimerase
MSEQSLTSMNVLVTGAAGFLGSHTTARLLELGATVHATSRQRRASQHPRLRWWQTDGSDPLELEKLLAATKPDVIYHFAGQVSAAPGVDHVLPTFSSLLGSTVHLLAAALEHNCQRIILTGSLTEPQSATAAPTSPYAAAKWASSSYARMFHALYGAPTVIVRPFMTYGPGQQREKLVPHTIDSLLAGKSPRLASGNWAADWIYVDDVIDGFLAAATRPGIDGHTFDLGVGELHSTRAVVEEIARQIDPNVELLFGALPDRPGEPARSADLAAARERLGWRPRTSLADGLARTIAWHRENVTPEKERQAS